MNILMFDGNSDMNYAQFQRYIHNYQLKLHNLGHYIKKFQLKDFNIPQEPGSLYSGDISYIFNSLSETDLIVFASPLVNGRMSVLTTQIQNLISTYYKKQHKNQHEKFTSVIKVPLFGAIVMPIQGFSDNDLLLSRLTQERIATDLHTILRFFITTRENITDAICETLESIKCHDDYADVIFDRFNEQNH